MRHTPRNGRRFEYPVDGVFADVGFQPGRRAEPRRRIPGADDPIRRLIAVISKTTEEHVEDTIREPALRHRSSRDVLAAHLRLRKAGELEQDLRENYSSYVVVLTARAVFRGHDGVRRSAHRLWAAIGAEGAYTYSQVFADDRMCLLEWRGGDDRFRVRCGVDSYLIEDGWITAHTIHYRVEDLTLSTVGDQVFADPDPLPPPGGERTRPGHWWRGSEPH